MILWQSSSLIDQPLMSKTVGELLQTIDINALINRHSTLFPIFPLKAAQIESLKKKVASSETKKGLSYEIFVGNNPERDMKYYGNSTIWLNTLFRDAVNDKEYAFGDETLDQVMNCTVDVGDIARYGVETVLACILHNLVT